MPSATGELDRLWLATLQEVAGLAAHEIKDSLNGVCLNVEVIRSRITAGGETSRPDVSSFAESATGQLEVLGERIEALLFLSRVPKTGVTADVALALRRLAALLIPAARADGGMLTVTGGDGPAETDASGIAVRLALGAGLLALVRQGGTGACLLTPGPETVVRFSHESAVPCKPDAAVMAAIVGHDIRIDRSPSDLSLIFPAFRIP